MPPSNHPIRHERGTFMAKNNRFQPRGKRGNGRSAAPPPPLASAAIARAPRKEYGEPFIVLEDESKQTFVYKSGDWVRYALSIAECREDGKVTELPQKMKRMTRYEIRLPVDLEV
jgi:hypothetical protein